MRATVLENLMMGTLDPLNIPVTMTLPVITLDPMMGRSPPSSGPVKGRIPVLVLDVASAMPS